IGVEGLDMAIPSVGAIGPGLTIATRYGTCSDGLPDIVKRLGCLQALAGGVAEVLQGLDLAGLHKGNGAYLAGWLGEVDDELAGVLPGFDGGDRRQVRNRGRWRHLVAGDVLDLRTHRAVNAH